MNVPKCEWLRPFEIRDRAEKVLATYHPTKNPPIPIEKIIDVDMGIDIVPLPGLKSSLDIDGFLSSDLGSIHVDEYAATYYENRYRFTLAHELGHLVLHDYIYRACEVSSIDEYRAFVQQQDPEEIAKMEWQAHVFAGYALVPDQAFKTGWEDILPFLRNLAKRATAAGFGPDDYSGHLTGAAAEKLCRQFQVSGQCMEKRIARAVKDHCIVFPP